MISPESTNVNDRQFMADLDDFSKAIQGEILLYDLSNYSRLTAQKTPDRYEERFSDHRIRLEPPEGQIIQVSTSSDRPTLIRAYKKMIIEPLDEFEEPGYNMVEVEPVVFDSDNPILLRGIWGYLKIRSETFISRLQFLSYNDDPIFDFVPSSNDFLHNYSIKLIDKN